MRVSSRSTWHPTCWSVPPQTLRRAGVTDRVRCKCGDVKGLGGLLADAVRRRDLEHDHPPHSRPGPGSQGDEGSRSRPGGTLMVRDLARPDSREEVARLVALYAGLETPEARGLFEASLDAALTLREIQELVRDELGIPSESARMTSDRHWTITWKRPG